MLINCDMCGTKIENGKCTCGVWVSKDEMKDHPFLKSIEHFHEMKKFTFTSDAAHLGCAIVLFRGDYNDCQKVQKFIYELKGRPFYEE
jgi:hypothetical protein